MRFCGRKEGISALSSFWKTVRRQNVSQMVCVIGRRRVGKTTLVLKAFENEAVPFLYLFVSQRVSESDLVQAWLNEVCRSAVKCFRHFATSKLIGVLFSSLPSRCIGSLIGFHQSRSCFVGLIGLDNFLVDRIIFIGFTHSNNVDKLSDLRVGAWI